MSDIERYIHGISRQVDKALAANYLPSPRRSPAELHQAMRYAMLNGGKRLRPVLTIASGEMFRLGAAQLMPVACAMEMVHTASLVYDDLPDMDDAGTRRGAPCLHVKYSQATAILAANSLLVLAFKLLADAGRSHGLSALDLARAVESVADTVGGEGMSGGQLMDLRTSAVVEKERREIDYRKTARLFITSAWLPTVFAAADELEERAVCEYARFVGLAYQLIDDLGDRDGSAARRAGHLRKRIDELLRQAKGQLARFGRRAVRLAQLVDYLRGKAGG